jgi:phosphohistidine phosphatase
MHRLHLLRHAKSDADEGFEDHQRPLSRRGRDDARRIGAAWPACVGAVDLVLCSPALRTRETADLVLAAIVPPPRILYESPLYLAAHPALLQRLRRLEEGDRAVLVIGHNPGLHRLALALAHTEAPHYKALASGKFPTSARASFKVEVPWSMLGQSPHALIDYATPKSLSA